MERPIAGFVAAILAVVFATVRGLLNPAALRGVWAEDGAVFITDAVRHPLRSLTSSYAGYGHLLPRLLAETARLVPIGWWPTYVLLTCLAVYAVVAWLTADAAARLGLPAGWCVAAAVVPFAAPAASTEILNSWADLQWVLLYCLVWLIIAPPSRRRFASATLAAFAVASGAFGWMALLLLCLRRGRAFSHPAAVGALVGVAYQAVIVVAPTVSIAGPPRVPGFSGSLLSSLVETPLRQLGPFHSAVLGLFVLMALLAAAVTSNRRRYGLGLLVFGTVVLVATSTVSGLVQPRYAIVFQLFLLAAGVLGVCDRRWEARWAVPTICLLMLYTPALPTGMLRSQVPPWSTGVHAAEVTCRADPHGWARIPVGPKVWGYAVVPCGLVA